VGRGTRSDAAERILQGFAVYRHGAETVARGLVDGSTLARGKSAADVLQRAVDELAREGGGELRLHSGVFVLDAPLRLGAFVRVSGSGRATVLEPGPPNVDGPLLLVEGQEGVVVADLTCQGKRGSDKAAGIVFDDTGDSEIRSVYARDFGGYGIWLRNDSFVNKVVGCTTSGNGQAGTFLQDNNGDYDRELKKFTARGGDYVPSLIANGISIGEGGSAFAASRALCTDFVGCIAYQPGKAGFHVRESSNSTLISGCRVYQGFAQGVLFEDSHEINVSSCTITWNWGTGIEVCHANWGTICGNCVIDSGGISERPRVDGIHLHTDTRSVQVSGNAIWNWDTHNALVCGVREAPDCRNNQITNNTVNHYSDKAAMVSGAGSVEAFNLGVPEFYPHPGMKRFPPETAVKMPFPEFDDSRVQAYLARTRRR
jgi:parallel beta-helix repeat protein